MINEKELQQLLKIKEGYLRECKICHGSGIVPNGKKDGDTWIKADTCECIKKFRVAKKMYLANIARPYWDKELGDILCRKNRKKIKKYIEKIDYCLSNNVSLFLSGGNSVGKSLMLNVILKELVLKKNIEARYYSLEELLDFTKTDQRDVDKYQIIAIDNVGEEYRREGSDYVAKNLTSILGNRFRNNKLTLIASRCSHDKLIALYGQDVYRIIANGSMKISIKSDIKHVQDIKHKIKNLLK